MSKFIRFPHRYSRYWQHKYVNPLPRLCPFPGCPPPQGMPPGWPPQYHSPYWYYDCPPKYEYPPFLVNKINKVNKVNKVNRFFQKANKFF